ncbi:epidermal retinol dehydrogenase 2-like isoform X2 [Aricia agestis]|nr:epidermal retinol dehydrogenase 2-like isoform X2 [Aricia agestis]
MLLRILYETLKSVFQVIVPPSPKDVKDDIILITGTGHGMGREVAVRLARLGATLVCVDINSANNEETAKIIKQEKGKAHAYRCDVTNRAAVMELAEKVKREVGDVTILVNNAGIMPCKPLLQQTEQEIRLMNDINIHGNLWMIQAFLPAMISSERGQIVAMSSMAGLMGLGNLVPYCGSKYAVRGIMDALAMELHMDPRRLDGIKLTTICPYMVDTGLCKKPRVRFQNLRSNRVVGVDEAADTIVDAIRRELTDITIPHELYYVNKFLYVPMSRAAKHIGYEFFNAGVDAHDD